MAVKKLSVHKNTVESRHKRQMAKDASAQISNIIKENDIRIYAFVGINANGEAHAIWDTGAIIPMRDFPAMMSQILDDDMSAHADVEDWKPQLPTFKCRKS